MADVDGAVSWVRVEDEDATCLKDITAVRITALVKSDNRVTYEAERDDSAGSSLTITETIKNEKFRWVKRDSSSAYSDEGTGEIRNDAALGGPMQEEVESYRACEEPMGSGLWLSVPWVEFTYRVGDRLMGIDGRGIELPATPGETPAFPMIEYVTYDFGNQETRLQLRVGNA